MCFYQIKQMRHPIIFPCEDGDNDDIYFVRELKFHFGECAVKVGTIQIQTRLRASLHTNSLLGQPQEF